VTFRQGGTRRRDITTGRAPHPLRLRALAAVYARRWDIEMAFARVKQHLKLRLLWSAKPGGIHQQVWATLSIVQGLQALRLEIAAQAEPVDVLDGVRTVRHGAGELAWLRAVGGAEPEGQIFLVDPEGRLMMRYDSGSDPYMIAKDLKRLLRLSRRI